MTNTEEKVYVVKTEPRFQIRRRFVGHAYPRNGNVHNPTPYFMWLLYLDGRLVQHSRLKRELVEWASRPGAVEMYSD